MSSQETFQKHFYSELSEINKLVESGFNEIASITDDSEKRLLFASKYEQISNRVEILQKYFNENTSFIPVYEIRKGQENLAKLTRLLQEKRESVFPKKKFGFKSKQNMTSLEDKIVSEKLNNNPASVVAATPATNQQPTFENSCNIKDLDGATVVKNAEEISGKDMGIVNVKNSIIQIFGTPSVLHIDNIDACTILCGPIMGSCFINKCTNSKLVLACHQLRIHETNHTQFYIHVMSRAIIENTNNVAFAPYAWTYPDLSKHFLSNNDARTDDFKWTSIDDFNCLNQAQKSPNWRFLDESERIKWSSDESGNLTTTN